LLIEKFYKAVEFLIQKAAAARYRTRYEGGVGGNLSTVVPANAGTHNPRRSLLKVVVIHRD
jgi:hypothetical protein